MVIFNDLNLNFVGIGAIIIVLKKNHEQNLVLIFRQTDRQTNLFTRIVKTKRKKKHSLIYLFDKTTMYDNFLIKYEKIRKKINK